MDPAKMNRAQRRAAAKRQRTGGTRNRRRAALISGGALLGAGATLIPATPAAAASFTVNSTGDGSDFNAGDGVCEVTEGGDDCTLRAAVEEANATPGPDVIGFQGELGTILLDGSGISIWNDVSIVDADGDQVVDAQYNSRIFYSGEGAPDITIEGLTLLNGDPDTDDTDDVVGDLDGVDRGGAIQIRQGGHLTLRDVTIENSHADVGGAVSVTGGELTIEDSQLQNNTADLNGGAIFVTDASGHVDVTGSSISYNTVGDHEYQPYVAEPYQASETAFYGYSGGGITFETSDSSYDLRITDTTVQGNQAPLAGGGIAFGSFDVVGEVQAAATSDSDLIVTGSTISDNEVGIEEDGTQTQRDQMVAGGGIAFAYTGGALEITGGSITGNEAIGGKYEGPTIGTGMGGGVFSTSPTTISGTTVQGNSAGLLGGGVAVNGQYLELGYDISLAVTDGAMILDNDAGAGGGVAAIGLSDVAIDSSTISGNTAGVGTGKYALGTGGGVLVNYLGGAMTVTDSTIGVSEAIPELTPNEAKYDGGGIAVQGWSEYASITVTNTTISGNIAGSNGAGEVDLDGKYDGASGGGISIQGQGGAPALAAVGDVEAAAYAPGISITLASTTISANASSRDGGGIAISDVGAGGSITISDTEVTGNTAGGLQDRFYDRYGGYTNQIAVGDGGGIHLYDIDAAVEIVDGSSISGNVAGRNGGGVSLTGLGGETGSFLLAASVVSGNDAGNVESRFYYSDGGAIQELRPYSVGDGGGLHLQYISGPADIVDTTIDDNYAHDDGGGLGVGYIGGGTGSLTVDGTTISNNGAGYDGGGAHVAENGARALFVNTTISGNAAFNGGGIWVAGGEGGVVEDLAAAQVVDPTDPPYAPSLLFSTVTGNHASALGGGGGVYLQGPGVAYLENTVVADSVESGYDVAAGEAAFLVNHVLVESYEPGSISDISVSGDSVLTDVDPQLGELSDNGGATLTHLPLPGSPLINAADPTFTPPPSTDQRDLARVSGGQADIGSVETQQGGGGGGGGTPPPAGDASIQLQTGAVTVDEDAGTVTITVVRSGNTTATSTVHYATSNGQNVSADDYTPTSGTLTFGPGQTTATFTIAINDDDLDEPDEVVNVTLSDPTGATLGSLSSGTVTIIDNDGNIICPEPAQNPFEDVPGTNTHSAAIACLAELGVTLGTGDGQFAPAQDVTRGQMASFIARVIEEAGGALPAEPSNAFPDDNGHEHELRINQLAELDIVGGFGDGTYRPNDRVTRGQMAKFLANTYRHLTGEELPVPAADVFDDDDGTEHELDINRIAAAGIAQGFGDGTYRPGLNVRRDQMASFLLRLMIAAAE